jgi:ATP-binding cassette, subfamily B, bacterial
MSRRTLLWPYIRPYRGVLAIGAGCAVAEVIAGLAQPWPLKFLIDDVLNGAPGTTGTSRSITLACLAIAGLVGFGALMDYWSTRLLSSAGLHLGTRLRDAVFAHLNRLSLQYHGQHRVGDLSTRVMGDVDRSQDMIVQLLAVLIPNSLLLVGMISVLFVLDPGFAVLALAITPMLALAVHRSTVQLKHAAKRTRKADGLVASATTEHLGAVHLVQAYALEERQERRSGVGATSGEVQPDR